MVSKTVTISEEAYKSLQKEKLKNESFSDVILRLTRRFGRVFESFGKWDMSDEEVKEFTHDLKSLWASWSEKIEDTDK